EIISEIEGVGEKSKKVAAKYEQIIQKAGSEFNVLLYFSIEKIKEIGGEILAEAIERMRAGNIHITEGYDGEYGKIRVFTDEEIKEQGLNNIFKEQKEIYKKAETRKLLNFSLAEYKELSLHHKVIEDENTKKKKNSSELNKEQQKAATHFGKPAMVIAGPGTGKTKVLTSRIAYLLREKKVAAEKIVAVTFTNKAAEELQQRIAKIVDKKSAEKLNVSTFHALGLQILKQYHENEKILIIDEDDKRFILKSIGMSSNKTAKMLTQMANVKSNLLPQNVMDDDFIEYFKKYQQKLDEYQAYDFDDLIYKTLHILTLTSAKANEIKAQFEYMLIDEYQDINKSQYELVRALMPDKKSDLFVIGDPNQSIYGFRGADIGLIDSFASDYNPNIYQLKKSYRCSNNILSASENIIRKNSDKTAFLSGMQKGVKIKLSSQETEKSEAEFIARTIENLIGGLGFFSMDSNISRGEGDNNIKSLSDFAVLCRSRVQMPAIVEAFKNHNIPFQVIGEERLINSKSVKKIIELLQFISFRDNKFVKNKLESENIKLPNSDEFTGLSIKNSIDYLTEKYFSQATDEEKRDLDFLAGMSEEFKGDAEKFINAIELSTQIEKYQPHIEAVTIMTMHASKGLEFETVFVAGCEEGLMPYKLFDRKSDEKEEQRLLYVAMTRAKKYLYLTNAKTRLLHGRKYDHNRSPFLEKIENDLLQYEKQAYTRKTLEKNNQLYLF
ncbi:MAG: UvrD-helicase domain-containing protein, partial [Bacteroidota bacterium]|nr:UvrD-helicase domain-containing protein [Bacteroidota bacterium]